ncbi:MAG: YdcF family protein [Oscillatoriales cyanobacterium C42_A2020_001]|nr:YdcF family protein [Leptolyngbyaceae cyanobacterium C42_A2020_001]
MLPSIPLSLWFDIRGKLLLWFSTPQLILFPLCALYLSTYFPQFRRAWKPTIRWATACLVTAYLLIISPVGAVLAMSGLTTFLPSDDGQPADALVILGRGRLQAVERTRQAAQLWRAQRAPVILASGDDDAPKFVRWLQAEGIPSAALLQEPCSLTTEENAVLSALILKQKQVNRVILITDTPHMLRSLLTFRSLGFEVLPHLLPLPDRPFSVDTSIAAFREYVGLAIYAFSGRFRDRSNLASSQTIQLVQNRLSQCPQRDSIASTSAF